MWSKDLKGGILYADHNAVHYTYDLAGRRTAMADSQVTTTYGYDALNRLTQVTDALQRTVRYEWTPRNQRSKVVYTDGLSLKISSASR